jgi:hypothetical protein
MTETQMQHHFGWKSAAMVVRYSRNSSCLKQAMAESPDFEADSKEKKTSLKKQREKKTGIVTLT